MTTAHKSRKTIGLLVSWLVVLCMPSGLAFASPRRPAKSYTARAAAADAPGAGRNGAGPTALRLDEAQFVAEEYGTKEGLTSLAQRLLQTRDGYLWIGAEEGLVRFDGVKFTEYRDRDALANRNLKSQALHESVDGTLWYGTRGGLNRFKNGAFTAYTTKNGLPDNQIRAVTSDAQGAIWVGTRNGLSQFKNNRFINYSTGQGLPSNHITSLHLATDNSLWVGTTAGLARWQGNHFTKQAGLFDEQVTCVYEDKSGRLWVGTNAGGLHAFENGKWTRFGAQDGLVDDAVVAIAEDASGRLWAATTHGISVRLGQEFRVQKQLDAAGDDFFNDLTVDREGGVWAGTQYDLIHLHEAKFKTFNRRNGLPSNTTFIVMQTRDGSLWSDSPDRGLLRLKNGRVTAYTTADGLSGAEIKALHETRDGALWIATEQGLNRFRDDRFTIFTAKDWLPDNKVTALAEDANGRLWVGAGEAKLGYFKDGKFTNYPVPADLFRSHITAIVAARDGSLWVGTYGDGVFRFKDDKLDRFTTDQGLVVNYIRCLYEDVNGQLWIGTNGGGVSRYRDGRITSYTTKQGLADDQVYQVLEDGAGNLWTTFARGASYVNKKQFDEFDARRVGALNSVEFGAADGIEEGCNGGMTPAGWKAADGSLWLAGNGLVTVHPQRIASNSLPPPVVVEQLIVDRRPVTPVNSVSLNPGSRDLEIHFAGLSLQIPAKVQFKYQLEGYDKDWVEAGARRTAYYTNLPPGTYRFRVIACNNDGVWNEQGAWLDFELQPYFYQTAWFRALCLVLSVVIVVAALRWRAGLLRRRELRRHEERFRSLIENASDIIMILDRDGIIRYHSPSLERLFGHDGNRLLRGDNLFAYVHADDQAKVRALLLGGMHPHETTAPVEFRYQHCDGSWRVQEAVGKSSPDQFIGEPVVVNSRDITDRKRVEEQLVHSAQHDSLTGLANRALFMKRLNLAAERARLHPERLFAVLFLDLDRFKIVNDSLGHRVGDELLIAIARRLSATVKNGDTLARLGGDEFVILLDNIASEANARAVAARVQKIFAKVFDLGGHQMFATASIGIALSNSALGSADELLRDADTAMYRAKALGKDCHQMFDQAMRNKVCGALQLETDLRLAVEREEFILHYQPIVLLDTGEIKGFEALVRWQHPERGLLAPGEFLPLAEETGLIVPIGWWVLREACRQLSRWERESPAALASPRSMSVNLSNQQLMQFDLVERVRQTLDETGCAPCQLKLEITESAMIDDAETTLERLEQLHQLGVEISIDDFGTGYSSLSYIHRFPVTTLKLDRSFISRLDQQSNGAAIVQSILMMARNLRLSVVAEGVETAEQLERLKDLRCEYGQGYKLFKPMSGTRAGELLRTTALSPSPPVAALLN